MSNLFLKVDKDLFSKGLNPTQIIIIAQVEEYMRNTGDCHVTDAQFAEMLGVSVSTVSREIKKLCELGYIQKTTKSIHGGGKQRNLFVPAAAPNSNLTSGEDNENSRNVNLTSHETSNCLFTTEQNDLIKDNREEKEKDKEAKLSFASAQDNLSSSGALGQQKEEFIF